MPEHLRALVVILFLAVPAYLLSRSCLAAVVGYSGFQRRWGAWLAVTLVVFLANNAWAYVLAMLLVVTLYERRESNPMALYLMLLFAAPPLLIEVPGFGVVNYLLNLNHDRLLSLAILLPAAVHLSKSRTEPRLGSSLPDKVLLAYVAYTTLMQLRETSVTDALRYGFYMALDVVLIYYVASRSLRDLSRMREALATLVIAAMPLAISAVFETAWGWLLYSSIPSALGARSGMGGYLMRDELLRSSVTLGQSIALGYAFLIAIGAAMFTAGYVRQSSKRVQTFGILVLGLLAALARGPWIGAFVLYLLQAALYRNFGVRLVRRTLGAFVAFLVVLATPFGDRLVDMLPYVGQVDAQNVEFRELLIDAGIDVFLRSPWTGSVNYLEQPEMLALMRGGLIDVVNSYLGIALAYGAIGLVMFVLMFALGLRRAASTFGSISHSNEVRSLARVLAATTASVLFVIYTVSSITLIPHLYWLLLGMMCALPGKGSAFSTNPIPDRTGPVHDARLQQPAPMGR